MNHKLKVLTTSLLVVGALTACNTDKDSAMERERDMHRQTAMNRDTDTVPNTTRNGSDMVRNTANNGRDTVATRSRDLMRDVSNRNVREHAADSERTSYWGYNDYPRSYGYAGRPDTVATPYTDMTRNVSVRGTDRTDRSDYRRATDFTNRNMSGPYRYATVTSTNSDEFKRATGMRVNGSGYRQGNMSNTGTTGNMTGTNSDEFKRATDTSYNGGNQQSSTTNDRTGRMNDMTGYDMTNYGMTGVTDRALRSRDYVTNRYSTPDAYDMNRVSYRDDAKTDHYGNVKYSKINQEIKQQRRNVTNDTNYNYYGSQNYHGHTTDNSYPTRNVTMNGYNVNGDGSVSEKINNRLKGMNDVDRVATVVYGNDVLVAVKPERNTSAATGTMENDIRQAVEPYAGGRNIHVAVTKTMYDRVRNMSNRLRDGSMTNQMNKDMNDLFNTLRTDYNRMNR